MSWQFNGHLKNDLPKLKEKYCYLILKKFFYYLESVTIASYFLLLSILPIALQKKIPVLIKYYSPSKIWSMIQHHHSHFLYYIDFCTALDFYVKTSKNPALPKYVIEISVVQSNLKTVLSSC